jgi:hypothetical protein
LGKRQRSRSSNETRRARSPASSKPGRARAGFPRAELLHVLVLPDFEPADRIGEVWGYPESRTFAELLIDCAEDQTLRALLVGDAAGG